MQLSLCNQKERIFGHTAHAFDKDVAEGRSHRVRYVGSKASECIEPGHWVTGGFPELVPFERTATNALEVAADTLNLETLPFCAQEAGALRQVRQDKPRSRCQLPN